MIVWITVLVFTFLVAHQLEGAVGDHLVGVHVRRRAGAALEDVELELVVQLAVDDLLAGAFDRGEDLLRESTGLVVGARGGQLHHREPLDEVRIEAERHARDLEVLERSSGLDAVIGVGGHGEIAEQVVFGPGS